MLVTLIVVLLVLAGFALVWWGINALTLPQPVKVVVLVILGLVMLAIVYQYVVGGGHLVLR